MKPFKPMLAAPMDPDKGESIETLTYPVLASPKFDGVRAEIIDGVVTSRSLKPIPNRFVQEQIGKPQYNGFDGELMCGESFQAVTSGIMSEDGEPDFTYYVFDVISEAPYCDRVNQLELSSQLGLPRIKFVLPVWIRSADDLRKYAAEKVAAGYEGVMVRKPDGPYKFGRSTFKEGYLVKVKPFETEEATVVGFEEAMHNGNAATTDALGRTERSSHKANLVPKGTLGALVCANEKLWPGQTFNIGTGFTQADRDHIWASRRALTGQTVSFQYQKIGTKDKPRCPSFRGFRDPRDL